VPRPGIKSALEYLKKRGLAMAIVTNGKSPFQERNTRSLSEYVFFDSIFVSESIGIRKPDKAIFHLACESLQAEVSASVFVGDNPIADVEGAKQAGMKTIYVPTDNSVNSCVHADAVVTNLFDLPTELDKLLA
jgi:putative hydrolase of the HAD superfamily